MNANDKLNLIVDGLDEVIGETRNRDRPSNRRGHEDLQATGASRQNASAAQIS